MRNVYLGPLVSALAMVGCAPQQDAPPSALPSSASSAPSPDDPVLEAVLLHELRAAATPDEAVCLRVRPPGGGIGDATAPVLAAIRRVYRNAVVASACSGGGGGPDTVKVKAGGRRAWMFDIGPVQWDGADAARVGGGGGSRGGTWQIRELEYRVVLQGGVWRVVSERVTLLN